MAQRDDKTVDYTEPEPNRSGYVPIQAPTGFMSGATDECY